MLAVCSGTRIVHIAVRRANGLLESTKNILLAKRIIFITFNMLKGNFFLAILEALLMEHLWIKMV